MQLVRFDGADLLAHLACDEILLGQAEAGQRGEMLRVYEVKAPGVVMGVGGRCRREVRLDACRAAGVPIARRCSGGGTVLVGPGCVLYSLVLDMRARPEMRTARRSYQLLLAPLAKALSRGDGEVQHAGLSDLALNGRKVGGSAQKRGRRYVLHHGTLLYNLPVDLMDRYLGAPPNAPVYRGDRCHTEFVTNLDLSRENVIHAFRRAYDVDGSTGALDLTNELNKVVADLTARKYGSEEWTYRR